MGTRRVAASPWRWTRVVASIRLRIRSHVFINKKCSIVRKVNPTCGLWRSMSKDSSWSPTVIRTHILHEGQNPYMMAVGASLAVPDMILGVVHHCLAGSRDMP